MIIIVAILSFVLSFGVLYFTRLYLARDKLCTGDPFFHLLISESIRKHQWKYPSSLQNVIFSECDKNYNYLAYPPLLHYVTALFPIRFHLKLAKIFNLVILSFVSSLAAIFAYNLTSNLGFAIFSSFIVIFNLLAFDLVIQFSPRPLGLLFYSLVACIAIFYPQNLFSLLAITLLVALISLTHKFAVQALIFGFLPYAFIFNRPYLILSFVFGFILSILISRGFYLRILKEHANWLRFYKSLSRKARVIANLRTIFIRNFWYLQIVALMFFIFAQKNGSLLHTDLISKVTFWAFINVLIALLVSVPALSFLGENYRYVEYSVIPVGIAISLFVASSNPYVWFISFACISMSFLTLVKFKGYLNHSKALVDPDDALSYGSLRDYGLSNLLVFPGNRTLEVNYFTELSVVHPVRIRSASEHFDNLINKYEIRYVLKFKGTDPYQLFATLTNIVNMKKILDFTNFELYKITPKNDSSVSNPPPAG